MSKNLIWVVIVIMLVVGVVTMLSRIDVSRPISHVEKAVPQNALEQ